MHMCRVIQAPYIVEQHANHPIQPLAAGCLPNQVQNYVTEQLLYHLTAVFHGPAARIYSSLPRHHDFWHSTAAAQAREEWSARPRYISSNSVTTNSIVTRHPKKHMHDLCMLVGAVACACSDMARPLLTMLLKATTRHHLPWVSRRRASAPPPPAQCLAQLLV
jgi:hypothetical protein